jgi:cold shock protein
MRVKGVVKSYNEAKGYGFITTEQGEDLFVHSSSLIAEGYKSLKEGESVSFDVVVGPKGSQAGNVLKLN